MAEKERILVIRNSALGDVAMTLPVLYSVATQYPESDFYLLTRPFFAKIFIDAPKNLHIIPADFKGEYKGTKGLLKLIKKLKEYHFTAVADLHNVLRSWVIGWTMRIGGKRVVIVNKRRSRRLTVSKRSGQESFIARYAHVFDRLGFPVQLTYKSLYGDKAPEAHTEIQSPSVGIAPFARYDNKTYPPELMEQVVSLLSKKGYHIYLYGARGAEAETLDAWAQKYPGVTSLAGKMDITQEIATMAYIDVMVSMDSANQHLASLTGTPVVSIWGSTAPGCGFLGYGQRAENAICLGIECQPCTVAGSKKCSRGTLACLRGISPQMVADKVESVLNKKLKAK